MYDPNDYRKSVLRSNHRPERYRVRRHSFGIGLAIFWVVYLAAMGTAIYYVTSYMAHHIP